MNNYTLLNYQFQPTTQNLKYAVTAIALNLH